MRKAAIYKFAGNALPVWGVAATVAFGTWVALRLIHRVARVRLKNASEEMGTRVSDLILALLQGTKWYFEIGLSLYIGAMQLTIAKKTDARLDQAMLLIVLAQLFVWGSRCIEYGVARYRQRHSVTAAAATSMTLITFVLRFAWAATLVLLALDNLGINITTLVAGLGVGGVAVALAVQSTLGDLLSSVSIVFDKPFVVGDAIAVDTFQGTVEHVGLKTTRLRSVSGEQIIISNSDLLKSRIRNYKRMRERQVHFTLGVSYATPHEHLAAIPDLVRAAVEAQPKTRFVRTHFKAYTAVALEFEVVYDVLERDYRTYMDTLHAINLAIFKQFGEEGIQFAYPTSTVMVSQGALPI